MTTRDAMKWAADMAEVEARNAERAMKAIATAKAIEADRNGDVQLSGD